MTQFRVGSLTGFTWGAVIAAATLASLILMAANGKKQGLKKGTVPVFGLLAVPLCVLAGRAGYYLFSLNRMNVIGVSFFDLREGGLMLYMDEATRPIGYSQNYARFGDTGAEKPVLTVTYQ